MTTLALPLTRSLRTHEQGAIGEGLPPVLLRVAVSVLALLATAALGRYTLHRFDAPVRELAITGALRHVQPDEVRAAIAPLLDSGKLFALDLDALRAAVERLPWVARVRIDRQWPARLGVRITEREPFARWGETDALSTEGVVFAPGPVLLASTLPKLGGAAGREREVMAMFGQLADRLSETPFALAGLTQDARGEWAGTTERGVVLRFGRANPVDQVARLKATVLPALRTRLDAVRAIDLRYANGFAVSWRDASETIETSEPANQPGVAERNPPPAAPASARVSADAAPGVTP